MEPGWISGVTLTSILWAAPGASVVRASGALPSPTARVRGMAAYLQLRMLAEGARGWEGMAGKDGVLCKMGGGLGEGGENPTLPPSQLFPGPFCSPGVHFICTKASFLFLYLLPAHGSSDVLLSFMSLTLHRLS